MSRPDGRSVTELRPVKLSRGWLDHAEGSVLVEFGRTRVLCAASVTEDVPRWRRGGGLGWVTAEYAMLPRATNTRGDRESVKGRMGGRTQEISRLVGRSLRACVDYKALGENTIVIDCDVLQADGGTRTAAVTGGTSRWPRRSPGSRTASGPRATRCSPRCPRSASASWTASPGSTCATRRTWPRKTDMNVVCTPAGDFVEIQGTAEREPFSRDLLGQLLDLAVAGCGELTRLQDAALALSPGPPSGRRPAGCDPPWPLRPSCWPRGTPPSCASWPGSWGAEDGASQDRGAQIRLAGLDEFPGAPDVPETGATFEENALLKARAIADYTGLPAVADDSGLCVDALNGMPGVLSARWAGGHGDDQANLELVLAQVADVPEARLGASSSRRRAGRPAPALLASSLPGGTHPPGPPLGRDDPPEAPPQPGSGW